MRLLITAVLFAIICIISPQPSHSQIFAQTLTTTGIVIMLDQNKTITLNNKATYYQGQKHVDIDNIKPGDLITIYYTTNTKKNIYFDIKRGSKNSFDKPMPTSTSTSTPSHKFY